jgi:Protein of unknown function (DUF3105)
MAKSGKGGRRGPSRTAAEREEARRRQLELDRQARRARRIRRLVTAGITLVVAILIVVTEVWIHRLNGEERRLLSQAPSAAATAGCDSVTTVRPYPNGLDRTHIGGSDVRQMPPLSSYPSIPPASGPHAPTPLDAGVYRTPPPIDRAIHSLEHAAVIVWFDPSVASTQDVRDLEAFFSRGNERNHVIVAPYSYANQGDAGKLPAGTTMALVAWHHVQLCARPSLPVSYAFVHDYRFNLYQPGAYRGDAPEKYAPI